MRVDHGQELVPVPARGGERSAGRKGLTSRFTQVFREVAERSRMVMVAGTTPPTETESPSESDRSQVAAAPPEPMDPVIEGPSTDAGLTAELADSHGESRASEAPAASMATLDAVIERLAAPAVSFVGYLPARGPRTTGETGPGVNGTEAGIAEQLLLKHGYYSNPVTHGISDVGPEGRMFREAVARGLVPDSVEGLGTLLAHLSEARASRHPAARAFFAEWFASPAARDVRMG